MRLAYFDPDHQQLVIHNKTIEFMQKHNASFNPINYLVCYEYISADVDRLNQEINEILDHGHGWSNILGVRLNEKYLESDKRLAVLIEQELEDEIIQSNRKTEELMEQIQGLLTDLEKSPKDARLITPKIKRLHRLLAHHVKQSTDNIKLIRTRLHEAKKVSLTDLVTRLSNEIHMRNSLPKLVDAYRDTSTNIILMLIDVRGFTQFNLIYGHELGDNLLRFYAKVLKDLGEGFVSWRIGPDEFLVATTAPDGDEKCVQTLKKAQERMRKAALRPKGTEKSIKPEGVDYLIATFDYKLDYLSNINYMYEEVNKLKLLEQY